MRTAAPLNKMFIDSFSSLFNDAILLKPDYSYYEKQWDEIIDILINHTLIVEDAGLGCAYIKLNSNKYKESIDLFLKNISTLENNTKFKPSLVNFFKCFFIQLP